MTDICLYFQVHQPYRLSRYTIFDIGKKRNYFDDGKNEEICRKVSQKCYLPMNKLLLKMIDEHPEFKASFSITGTALEQFEKYSPEVLRSFQKLADTKRVEFLSETYHHSLSFLFNKAEFREQVKMHQHAIMKLFGQKPKVFRNTELIYNNALGKAVEELGYSAVIAEGAEHVLKGKTPNHSYKVKDSDVNLLLKNFKLSDDIAFRFGNKQWESYPLTAEKFAAWASPVLGDSINLFMDYETFGEHQWEDTGIFKFMERMPSALKNHGMSFHYPSEIAVGREELDVHNFVSWADVERDTSAWLGNKMQDSAAMQLYALRDRIIESGDMQLLDSWRRLTTSDHFYYMCTKWFNDGDVHKYFNPYDSPYECYMAFMNALEDMKLRLKGQAETDDWIKI